MIKVQKNQVVLLNEVPRGYTLFGFGHPKTHKTTKFSAWSDKGTEKVLLIDAEQGGEFVEGANRIVVTSINPPERIMIDKDTGIPLRNKHGLTAMEVVPPEERGYTYRTGVDVGKPMPVYSLLEVIQYLGDNIGKPEFPYETIVLDTLDAICEMYQDIIADELDLISFGTADWGKDIGMLKEKIRTLISIIREILMPKGKNLILISHAKDKVKFEGGGKDGKGKATIQLSSTLYAGVANIVSSLSEVIGYISITKTEDGESISEISFNNSDEQHIGSRIRALAGKVIPFSYESFEKTITGYKKGVK